MRYQKIQVYFLGALLIGALLLSFLIFLPYFGALLLATTFAVIFQPFYLFLFRWVSKVIKFRRGEVARIVCAFITLLILIVILLIPLMIVGIQLFGELRQLYTAITEPATFALLDDAINRAQLQIGVFLPDFSTNVNEYIGQAVTWASQHIGSVFSSVGKVFLALFLSLLAFYYLIKDGQSLRDFYIRISPLPDEDDERILVKLQATVNSVIRGTLVIAVIQGFLTGIGFMIFGIPNPTLWGSVAAISALVPTIGTAMVLIPGIIYLFIASGTPPAVGLLIWGIVAVGLIDNFLGPQVMKRGVSIHPFVILLSVLGGLSFFGPIGFLIGPLIISLLFALLEIYIEIIEPVKRRAK